MLKGVELRILAVMNGSDLVSSALQSRKKLSAQGPNGHYHEFWTDWEDVPIKAVQVSDIEETEEDEEDDAD